VVAAVSEARRPLSARSVVLSTLLGSDPPVLPVGALVAVGELFGASPGTIRTALSRMVAAGELEADDGRYRLVGRLLDRRAAQETGRRPPAGRWDGRWWWVVVGPEGRPVAERREFRTRLTDHRFGELRPEVWLRPANLAPPPPGSLGEGVLVGHGTVEDHDQAALAARLWDLEAWADEARRLTDRLASDLPALRDGGDEALGPGFELSAEVLRLLRRDPLLPDPLLPPGWPGPQLRAVYDRFDAEFRARLGAFLRARR
jgi:phenylacetic acid degradation operon negative regulatory protein